jgi:hypothetical protein
MDDSNTQAIARLAEVIPLLEDAGWERITHIDVWGVKDGVAHKMTVMVPLED